MTEKFPSTGLNTLTPSVFSHSELRQVLSAYAEGVLQKGWKDYALTGEKNQTTFCVIERGQGDITAVIYSFSKTRSKKSGGKDFYRVFEGDRQIHRSEKFIEALNIFREAGKIKTNKKGKFKIIK